MYLKARNRAIGIIPDGHLNLFSTLQVVKRCRSNSTSVKYASLGIKWPVLENCCVSKTEIFSESYSNL